MAGGEGFEPPLAESESAVLPLDDPPVEGSRASASSTVLLCGPCAARPSFAPLPGHPELRSRLSAETA